MLKYFALAVGSVAAWDLEPFGNQTFWPSNDNTPNGAALTFDNSAGSWNNGTGSCTVSLASAVSSINAGGYYVDEWAGGNDYTFRNFRASDSETFSFDMVGTVGEAEWASDFASVNCDDSTTLASGDMRMGVFPHGAAGNQGNVGAKDAAWASFVMSWPSATNMTFSDPRVMVTDGNGSTDVTIDASMAVSEDLWFEYETDYLMGSYEISVTAVL